MPRAVGGPTRLTAGVVHVPACVSIVGWQLRMFFGNRWTINGVRHMASTAPSGHHAIDYGAVLGAVHASALRADRAVRPASGIDGAGAQLRISSYVMARVGRKSSRAMGLSGIHAFVRSTGIEDCQNPLANLRWCPDRTRQKSQASGCRDATTA